VPGDHGLDGGRAALEGDDHEIVELERLPELDSDGVVPRPGEAMVYLPGLALIRSTSSFTDLAGMSGWTSSACGAAPALVIGMKSLSGSYGTLA
jgi:hypothetical protein